MTSKIIIIILVFIFFILVAFIDFFSWEDTQPLPIGKYPLHEEISTTVFWVGEEATEENNYITNEVSFWDKNWQENFGGVDNPQARNGYLPHEFIPKENPFYFALPYSDFEEHDKLKESIKEIPWYKEQETGKSILKNRWIRIIHMQNVCFAQWQDVGPGETDDFDYVFKDEEPINDFSALDVSPAVKDCLQMDDRAKTSWEFVDFEDIPNGPWKEIITTSGINW